MLITLQGYIEYDVGGKSIYDIEDVEFKPGTIQQINNRISDTLNEPEYKDYFIDKLNKQHHILNDIKKVYVDEDIAYMDLDIIDDLTDEQIVNIFKPILEEIIYDADIEGDVHCGRSVSEDVYNSFRGEYYQEDYYEVWDDYLTYDKKPLTDCKVTREEDI